MHLSAFNFRSLARATLVLIPALLLLGCAKSISLENYNKLQIGQTYDEVGKIVGPPARCDELLGIRSCSWGDDEHGFGVNFVAGKVILLSARGLK